MALTSRGYILIDLSNLDIEFDIDQFINQNLGKIDADVVAINASLGTKVALSLFTAANDFVVGTGVGTAAKKTLAETKTILGINNGTESASGVLELATVAETITGTDVARAVHPAGLLAMLGTNYFVKRSCKVATTANITLSAPQTIDGISVVAGDRVLVKNQTTASSNGIYVVAAGAWTRATDADTAAKVANALVAVDQGSTQGGWLFDNDFKSTDTLGTTSMTFNAIADSGKKLSHFAATTSAELAGVISDETGSGSLVFAISPTFGGIPLTPTAAVGTNTLQIASTAFVQAAIAAFVDAAPATLDTLNELAAALGDDPNFATTMTNALAGKLSLSTFTAANDFVIGSGAGTVVKKTVSEIQTILGLASAAYTSSTAYATSAQGAKADAAMPKTGGTFSGAVACGRQELQQPKFKDYSEVVVTNAAATGTVDINLGNGNVFDITLTGATTFTFSNPAASGQAHSFTMILRQGATAQAVTWPASVKWPGDTIPIISDVNRSVILTFVTLNGGSRWYGMAATKFTT